MTVENYSALKNTVLTKELLKNAGKINGTNFVKVVYDIRLDELHFLDNEDFQFHADYISEVCLSTPRAVTRSNIDKFNIENYKNQDRRFLIGIISFVTDAKNDFFTLETVEIDTMSVEMIKLFYSKLRHFIELKYKLLFKPSSHDQEILIANLSLHELPRILNRDLVSQKKFTSLNSGESKGRLRCFETKEDYKNARDTLEWFDIILMPRVPDSIPRLSGIINSHPTTPLSHTNVLAHSWGVPNAIQLGAFEKYQALNGSWVCYTVDENSKEISLEKIERPEELKRSPSWQKTFIKLEEPDSRYTPIKPLNKLRLTDRYIYGTKAANLGELYHVMDNGSAKMLGFYRIPRGPRPNFLPYLERYFKKLMVRKT